MEDLKKLISSFEEEIVIIGEIAEAEEEVSSERIKGVLGAQKSVHKKAIKSIKEQIAKELEKIEEEALSPKVKEKIIEEKEPKIEEPKEEVILEEQPIEEKPVKEAKKGSPYRIKE